MSEFDLEAVYDAEIAPLLTQIIAICKRERLPMLASFFYHNSEEHGAGYSSTFLPFDERPSEKLEEACQIILHRAYSLMEVTCTPTEVPSANELMK